jgi:hypothetical protein
MSVSMISASEPSATEPEQIERPEVEERTLASLLPTGNARAAVVAASVAPIKI